MPQLYENLHVYFWPIHKLTIPCHILGSNPITPDFAMYYRQNRRYWSDYEVKDIPNVLHNLHKDAQLGLLERMDQNECLNRYATSIQSNRRSLLLVASDDKFPTAQDNRFINGSHVYWASPFYASDAMSGDRAADSYQWICSALGKQGTCSSNVNEVHNNPSAWRVGNNCEGTGTTISACNLGTFPVEYCLSQPAEPHCKLQFDKSIAILVTFLNLSKLFFQ
jgi:hypothetical protein